ncbi:oxidoreductase, short chain dehydrogenase/reductase family [Streptococcus pneumoniae]|nr:oxidoreductase, short chain dehydrogenase/reductase family [Streptococcus pneumoniae]
MIFTYNKEHVGDVLMVIVKNSGDAKLNVERKGKVARVFLKENGETVAWNIFEVSSLFEIAERGQVFLSDEQVARLNQELQAEGFTEEIVNDKEPKFVVGEIVEMVAHPDSDHLNICQVAVASDKIVQIVAGAPNARVGLKTIVALPGAMMPKGNLIFPGELRGEKSFGMMCSPRELHLPNAPQKRGVLELSEDQVVGTPSCRNTVRPSETLDCLGTCQHLIEGNKMAKNVVITGATSGIGEAIARAYLEQGEDVVLTGRRIDRLEILKWEFAVSFPNQTVWTFPLDVTDMVMVKTVCSDILETIGRIDILVNNAGLALDLAPYQDYEELDMLTMLDTNVKGLMAVTRCFLPAMIKVNQGHIINMGSTAGIYAYAGAAVYSATKAAVKTFSDGLRIDTIATDIKVTTIQPGIVETDFSTVRFHGDKERAASVYQGIEALQAQDIADTVVYVTSQPRRVQITDMTIMANQQATGFMIHKK